MMVDTFYVSFNSLKNEKHKHYDKMIKKKIKMNTKVPEERESQHDELHIARLVDQIERNTLG